MEVIGLDPVDEVRITTIVDSTVDMTLAPQEGVRRSAGRVKPATGVLEGGRAISGLRAEHGVSMLVETTRAGVTHRVLFDAGLTPTGVVDNMRTLGIDPGDIEAIILSHGHADHTTGMDGLIGAIGRTNLPVLIHPEFWTERRIRFEGRDPIELPVTSRRALEDAGFAITEDKRPSFLLDGSMLLTGEVERSTDYESGFPGHEAHRHGAWEPDPLILDDQALVVNVAGEGLLVMTGCGHAGVVNTIRQAKAITGVDRLRAIVGGFHLSGPLFEPRIAPTVDALLADAPGTILPSHCTGWKAVHRIAATMPDAFVQNSVGSTVVIGAA